MKSQSSSRKTPPILQAREASGGEIATTGLRVQSDVALAFIPRWLAQDGFTSVTLESMGDIEAKFFVPSKGYSFELVEVKDHVLAPATFWREIKRFMEMDARNPGTYRKFTLVCAGLTPKLSPLINELARVRNPWEFYTAGSAVRSDSHDHFIKSTKKMKRTSAEATFLFDRVAIDMSLNAAKQAGMTSFAGALIAELPEYKIVTASEFESAYYNLKQVLDNHLNQPITRRQLEAALRGTMEPSRQPDARAVHLHTLIQDDDKCHLNALRFHWSRFFVNETRRYPPAQEWKDGPLSELSQSRDWIIQHRENRRIKLTGNRRLSASFAIGYVLSAVAGFSIDMEVRDGEYWRTDNHAGTDTPDNHLDSNLKEGEGQSLVVVLSIGRDILAQVQTSLQIHALGRAPIAYLNSNQPIVSASQANLVVGLIKQKIIQAVEQTNCSDVHLFMAVPSFIALLLGHRFNAVAAIQCYEWIASGRYVCSIKVGGRS